MNRVSKTVCKSKFHNSNFLGSKKWNLKIHITAEGKDLDHDGYVTFWDITLEERANLRAGYTTGYRSKGYGYEMAHNLSRPFIMDVYMNTSVTRYPNTYSTQAYRTKSYYQHIRDDKTIYPNQLSGWFVSHSYGEGDNISVYVNCTGNYDKLVTPETIYYKGGFRKVTGLDLTNCNVTELTITDNINTILRCQTPMLKVIKGGANVETICNFGFKDNLFMTNMPYFPKLKTIGLFAFQGCFHLSEVLLPPFIEYIAPNAFGWYDVIKGNYDQDSALDYELLGSDTYTDKYKMIGITLYYTEGTTTEETIKRDFENNEKRFVNLAPKDKYPGKQPPVEIPDEEYRDEGWLSGEPTEENWTEPSDTIPTEPAKIESSVNLESKMAVSWLNSLLLESEIDAEMYTILLNSMCGMNEIPIDFVTKYGKAEQITELINLYCQAALRNDKIAEFSKKEPNKAAELNREKDTQNKHLINYAKANLSVLEDQLKEMEKEIPDSYGKGLSVIGAVIDCYDYYMAGDSFETAFSKAGLTLTYDILVGMVASSSVNAFELVILAAFGNSKAADAGSLITTGKHYIELLTDIYVNSIYDAWKNSSEFADNVKWRAFFSLSYKNISKVLSDLCDMKNAKYGQNLTNLAVMLDMMTDSDNFRYIFNGLMDMYSDGTLISSWSNTVYDVTVKGSDLGKIMMDYIASFYEEKPDLLTEYAKERVAISGKK